MTVPYAPGVHDIPEADYFGATEALSCSGAKLLLPPSCPAMFRYRQENPEYKDVFDFGSAAHKFVLGAGPEIVIINADDWKTKAAREERDAARAEGKTPLLPADARKVTGMATAIWQHPLASALLNPDRGGHPERSLFWTDEETGIPRRCRVDWLPEPGRGRFIVTDYKSCSSADPAAIAKAVANYGYHQQDAWYLDGVRALLDEDPAFVFVFQEKTEPYLVTVVQLDEDARAAGRARNRQAIERFRDCTEAGIWPGYAEDIIPISLPLWALRDLEFA